MRQKDVEHLAQIWSDDVPFMAPEERVGYEHAVGVIYTELKRWDVNGLDLTPLERVLAQVRRTTPTDTVVAVTLEGAANRPEGVTPCRSQRPSSKD